MILLVPAVLFQTSVATPPLIDAVRGSDPVAVRQLLESGADPNVHETLITEARLLRAREVGVERYARPECPDKSFRQLNPRIPLEPLA